MAKWCLRIKRDEEFENMHAKNFNFSILLKKEIIDFFDFLMGAVPGVERALNCDKKKQNADQCYKDSFETTPPKKK